MPGIEEQPSEFERQLLEPGYPVTLVRKDSMGKPGELIITRSPLKAVNESGLILEEGDTIPWGQLAVVAADHARVNMAPLHRFDVQKLTNAQGFNEWRGVIVDMVSQYFGYPKPQPGLIPALVEARKPFVIR